MGLARKLPKFPGLETINMHFGGTERLQAISIMRWIIVRFKPV
jgi:hypothetical protein